MKAAVSKPVLRSLGVSSELRSVNQKVFAWSSVQIQRYSQRAEGSSTPNPGTVEASTVEAGREDGGNTPVSDLDVGGKAGGQNSNKPKKSRTGGDMSDEGQVHTPNLGKTLSTREIMQSKGRETEERLAAEKNRR